VHNKERAAAMDDAAFKAQQAVSELRALVIEHHEEVRAADDPNRGRGPKPVCEEVAAFLEFLKTECPHPPPGREGQTWQWMADGRGLGSRVAALKRMLNAEGVASIDRFRARFVLTVFYKGIASAAVPSGKPPVKLVVKRTAKVERFDDFKNERCPFLAGDWKWAAMGAVDGGRHRALVKYLELQPEGKHAKRCKITLEMMK